LFAVTTVVQMNLYMQTGSDFSVAGTDVNMIPDFIVGNDFISLSTSTVGVNLNTLAPSTLLLMAEP